MPFTEKQRRFFHAAAARGQKGMQKLADEADDYASVGAELPPVGVAGSATHLIHEAQPEEADDAAPWSRLRGEKR